MALVLHGPEKEVVQGTITVEFEIKYNRSRTPLISPRRLLMKLNIYSFAYIEAHLSSGEKKKRVQSLPQGL